MENPFTLFTPFSERFSVLLFTKADALRSDEGERVADALGVDSFAALNQVHGNRTIIVQRPFDRTERADGMITDAAGLALIVRAADCQTFVAFAPHANVCGVLHVGWRGLNAGAMGRFFATLEEEFGIPPRDVFIAAGPSLCMKCAEFTDPSGELPNVGTSFVHGRNVDLCGAADAELRAVGVRRERLERDPRCTRCERETFWTYRGGDHDAVEQGFTNVLACCLSP